MYHSKTKNRLEKEYQQKRIELQQKHQQEINDYLAASSQQQQQSNGGGSSSDDVNELQEKVVSFQIDAKQQQPQEEEQQTLDDDEAAAVTMNAKKLKKIEKLNKKKIEQKLKDEQIAIEMANAPSLRQNEINIINQQLKPFQLHITDIPADGNCLYRAIASQMNRILDQSSTTTTNYTYKDISTLL